MVSAVSSSIVMVTPDELRVVVRDAVRECATGPEPEVLTLEQAAAFLQISAVTARKYITTRALPAIPLGPREWRFRRSDLLTWLDMQRRGGR